MAGCIYIKKGTITMGTTCREPSYPPVYKSVLRWGKVPPRTLYVEFKDDDGYAVALNLHKTVFLDRCLPTLSPVPKGLDRF